MGSLVEGDDAAQQSPTTNRKVTFVLAYYSTPTCSLAAINEGGYTAWARARVVALWDEWCDENEGAELTDAVATELVIRASSEARKHSMRKGVPAYRDGWRERERLIDWLHEVAAGETSPWVDEVALERAANWDWDAYRGLTPIERVVLARRLAAAGWVSPDIGNRDTVPGWMEGSPVERRALCSAVQLQRRRMKRAAA